MCVCVCIIMKEKGTWLIMYRIMYRIKYRRLYTNDIILAVYGKKVTVLISYIHSAAGEGEVSKGYFIRVWRRTKSGGRNQQGNGF